MGKKGTFEQEITTTEQLANLLQGSRERNDAEISPQNLRFVVYARKSTDEKGKQVRSLEDQVSECREYAEREGLFMKKIIQESESAKEPGIRPKFQEMLQGLQKDDYDGVIAWHPDRLARNMREAGEIIDMLDKQIIRSLRFPSFNFTNDTAGKMVLGMTFVIAKQYSDNLSDGVHRGNKRNIKDGKYINKSKHGYYKDKNQFLRPDENNFILIKNAFQMRKAGETLDKIASYLTAEGLTRLNSRTGVRRKPRMAKQQVSKILRDPIYTGVVVYGDHVEDLTKIYDFVPAVSVEDFCLINKFDKKSDLFKAIKTQRGGGKSIKADLLVQMVSCSTCGDTKTTGISKGSKGQQYFYFRCENSSCEEKSKNTRGHVIINFVKDYLRNNPFATPEAYEHYKEELKRVNAIKLKDITRKIAEKQMALIKAEQRVENTTTLLSQETDKEMQKHLKDDLKKQKVLSKKLGKELVELRDEQKSKRNAVLTFKEFLELFQKMAQIMDQTDDMKVLDTIIRKMFSNFSVSSKKVESYTLSTPFNSLETKNVSDCGR